MININRPVPPHPRALFNQRSPGLRVESASPEPVQESFTLNASVASDAPAAGKSAPPWLASRILQLRAAMDSKTWNPAPETLALLQVRPEIGATLLGLLPSSPLPADVSPRQKQDLNVLTDHLSLIGHQNVHLASVKENPEQLMVVNHHVAVDASDDLNQEQRYTRQNLNFKAGKAIAAASLSRGEQIAQSKELAAASLQSLQSGAPLAASGGLDSVRQVGLIAYCSNPEDLQKCQDNLKDWDQNFQTFGHRDRVLRICDDSPPQQGEALRAFADGFQSPAGTRIEYWGRPEKEALRQNMIESIMQSPTLAALAAQGEKVDRAAIDQMTLGMFGGQKADGSYSSGPTQNRNLSALLLQGSESFQADHDMLPRLLTKGAEEDSQPLNLPVDLLAQLSADRYDDRIASPRFTGAGDLAISRIVEKSLFPSNAVSRKEIGESETSPELTKTRSSFRTAAPLSLPAEYTDGGFLPIAPSVRDGDILVGGLMNLHKGPQPYELTRSILHTEKAGSKWGGEAPLVRDTLISSAVSGAIESILTGSERLGQVSDKAQKTTEETADAILKAVRADSAPPPEVTSGLKDLHAKWAGTTGSWVANRTERVAGLGQVLDQIKSGDPKLQAQALSQWEPESQHDSLMTPLRALAQQPAIEAALQQSQGELGKMQALFPADEAQSSKVVEELSHTVSQHLRDYALCLKFRHEILQVTREAGLQSTP